MEIAPRRFWPILLTLSVALLAIQLLFLPLAGIDGDESLFAQPFLRGIEPLYSWHFGGIRIPVMSLSYIGALKTWLYWPIFQIWGTGVWSVRLPVCLISLGTMLFFGNAVRSFAGPLTAILAATFLALDPVYIVTNVYDWGPVALLLLSTAAILHWLCRFGATARARYLQLAFFSAGVATWYKTIYVALFVCLLASLVIVYFQEIRSLTTRVSWQTPVAAVVAFASGCSPLIIFNVTHDLATVNAGAALARAPIHEKLVMMLRTLDGRALEHLIFRSSPHEKVTLSGADLPELVAGWYRTTAMGPGSAMPLLLLLCLLALPFFRRTSFFRPLLCGWIACITFFALMLGFRDAGAGPHHTVLIYPGPQFIVAATMAALAQVFGKSGRLITTAAACLLVFSNLYLVTRYFSEARHNGFSELWTASTHELSRTIQGQNRPVAFLDWSVGESVQVESGDTFPLAASSLAGDGTLNENALYATRCEGYVLDEGRMKTFEARRAQAGLERTAEGSIPDPQGERIYCLFMLRKAER